MTTSIKRTLTGNQMDTMYEHSELFSIRYYCARDAADPNFDPEAAHEYDITIRHPEDTKAGVLFDKVFRQQGRNNSRKSLKKI